MMPKYKPTEEDLDYKPRTCALCGEPLIDGESLTCSEFCQTQWEWHVQELEADLLNRCMDIEWGDEQ